MIIVKKFLSVFMAFLAMILLTPNVSAETMGEMTADELLATAENKTITLDGDVTLTTNLVVDGDVEVIDLNNHTLTLKGDKTLSSGMANPVVVNSELEIKNGTIARYVAPEGSSDISLIRGSIVKVSGSSADLVLNKVTLDGKDLDVTTSTDNGSYALFVIDGASATLNDSKVVNNNVITGNSNWGSTIYGNAAKSIILNNTEVSNNSNEDSNRGGIIYITATETVEINNSEISDILLLEMVLLL